MEVVHELVQQTGTPQRQERECAAEKEMEREAATRKKEAGRERARTARTHGLMSAKRSRKNWHVRVLCQFRLCTMAKKKQGGLMELMGLDKNTTGRFPHDENSSTKTANQVPQERIKGGGA